MFLTEKPNYPSFDSFNKQKKKKEFDLISQSFDESILRRLNALCNSHSSGTINFSWLSSALAFVSFTHNQAITLLSNPKLTDSLNFYLDDSVKLLDICNSIATEIERLRHRRLLLKLAIHLFNNNNNSEDAEKLRRARASLTDWDNNLKGPRYESSKNLEHLVIDLAFMLKEVPRGKISSDERIVRRTIHSVGLVTVFVAGVVVAALRGSTELGVAVRATSEFLWADSFNILNSAISAESGKKRHLLEELDDVEARLREVIGVMDDAGGEKGGSLNGAVKELERVTETLGEGLERLSNGVNEVFNTVMSSRKEMLERMRVGQQKQQTK
ncbi:hypothetical protein NC651_019175 [Populus alba x Populus x berolinensis]|nr:hypothetical protein NC651_019164 [Populus alba x Populus x berolinensis]KAJ6901334.1 hypothetical protein NC651_019175 [Populus alba x Populus x berolinensis]